MNQIPFGFEHRSLQASWRNIQRFSPVLLVFFALLLVQSLFYPDPSSRGVLEPYYRAIFVLLIALFSLVSFVARWMNRQGRQSLALMRFLIGVVLFSGAILAILDNIGRQDLSAVCVTVFMLPVVIHMGPKVYLGLVIPYAILLSIGILIWGGMNIHYLGILIQIWGYTSISIVIQKILFSNRLDRYLCQLEILDANARIAKLASRDSVTGLYNQKHFESLLNAEWQRSRRHSHVFSMIQLELDFPVGDEVLRHVGAYLQTLLRRSDHAARLADARFLLLLVETEMEGACTLAERLRVGLAQLPSARELGHAITASIGVATSSEAAGIDALQQLVAKRMKSARVCGPGHILSK